MKLNYKKNLENFFDKKNKKIIITGCSGQLGKSFVETFINFGCVVIGIDHKVPKKKFKKNFYFYEMDISDYKKNNLIFKEIFKKFKKIDFLINNAGVAIFDDFTKRTEKDLDWVIVNLNPILYTNNFYKLSDKKQSKLIFHQFVQLLVRSCIYGANDRNSSEIYGNKRGINQITKYLLCIYQKNIRVNSISPGGIYTK